MNISSYSPSTTAYNKSAAALQKSLLQIAAGQRINRAADNAAGLAISEAMQGQISGLTQASSNTTAAVSMASTAESAMSGTTSALQRMRELSIYSGNGTLTDSDKDAIQSEMDQLSAQINATAANTEFNTIKTNDGTLRATIQSGANSGQFVDISVGSQATSALGLTNVAASASTSDNLKAIDSAVARVSSSRSQLGATINGLEASGQNTTQTATNLQAADSRSRDTDVATQAGIMALTKVQLYAGIMSLSQATKVQQNTLSLQI